MCALVLTALVFTETVSLPYILIPVVHDRPGAGVRRARVPVAHPALVPRRTLPNAVRLNSIQFNLAQSVGPLIGGLVFTTLGLVAWLRDQRASFLVVIVVLSLLRVTPPDPASGGRSSRRLKGGLTYVASGGALLALTVLAVATTALGLPLRAFLPVFAGDPTTLSHMMTSLGTGAVAGALVVAWLGSFDGWGSCCWGCSRRSGA